MGGYVIDGSETGGNPARVVEIIGDRVVYVGADRNSKTKRLVDASGFIVSPAFIDPHTHAENELFDEQTSSNQAYLFQGVSTVFIGNDGGNGRTVSEMRSRLSQNALGTNVGLLSGHGTIRERVMGPDARPPDAEELESMRLMVQEDMQSGALGLSTGLFYAPGSFAETEELVVLSKVAAEFGGLYETHLRDEGDYSIGLEKAVREALEVGQRAKLPVHIAHIKALGPAVHGQSEAVIGLVESAQAEGQRVTADQYPWKASGTRLSNALVPRHLMSEGQDAMHEALADTEIVEKIRPEMQLNLVRRGGGDALLITGQSVYQGETLLALANATQSDPIDKAVEIIRSGDPAIASFMMLSEDVTTLMKKRWVVTSSDGSVGHPRKFASFPRKFAQYVEGERVLDRVAFVHRSSGLTAEVFSLCNRGRLAKGYFADVLIWDPTSYAPQATYAAPTRRSTGVVHLWVNGVETISEGAMSNSGAGRVVMRSKCDS